MTLITIVIILLTMPFMAHTAVDIARLDHIYRVDFQDAIDERFSSFYHCVLDISPLCMPNTFFSMLYALMGVIFVPLSRFYFHFRASSFLATSTISTLIFDTRYIHADMLLRASVRHRP